jgi:hypothetical protein
MAAEKLELESRPPLTADGFEALAEQQGWNEDTPVELLDGELVWMSTTNDPYVGCINRLTALVQSSLGDGARIDSESSAGQRV